MRAMCKRPEVSRTLAPYLAFEMLWAQSALFCALQLEEKT